MTVQRMLKEAFEKDIIASHKKDIGLRGKIPYVLNPQLGKV